MTVNQTAVRRIGINRLILQYFKSTATGLKAPSGSSLSSVPLVHPAVVSAGRPPLVYFQRLSCFVILSAIYGSLSRLSCPRVFKSLLPSQFTTSPCPLPSFAFSNFCNSRFICFLHPPASPAELSWSCLYRHQGQWGSKTSFGRKLRDPICHRSTRWQSELRFNYNRESRSSFLSLFSFFLHPFPDHFS